MVNIKICIYFNDLNNHYNLNFVEKEIDGNNWYYSKSRDDYESATTDLNLCKTQGFSNAVILVFKDGIETTLEQTLKSFK